MAAAIYLWRAAAAVAARGLPELGVRVPAVVGVAGVLAVGARKGFGMRICGMLRVQQFFLQAGGCGPLGMRGGVSFRWALVGGGVVQRHPGGGADLGVTRRRFQC